MSLRSSTTQQIDKTTELKTIIFAFVTLTSFASAATTTMTFHYANKYLSFGSGAVLHNDQVIQAGITTSFENGLYVGLWGSYSPDGESNLGDEFDFTLGWSGSVGKGWNMNYSIAYFDEPQILEFGAGDILYNKLVFSRPIDEYNFSVTIRHYQPMSGSGFEGGWLIGTSVSRGFKLSEKTSIFASIELNHDDGGFGGDSGLILNPFVSLSYSINDSITWDVIQANGYIPLTVSDARKNDIMWSTGFKYSF